MDDRVRAAIAADVIRKLTKGLAQLEAMAADDRPGERSFRWAVDKLTKAISYAQAGRSAALRAARVDSRKAASD